MNRPIKFRAWDRKEKEMILGAAEIGNFGLGDGSLAVDEKAQRGNELDWMQFTGLLDCKGKEIYEGDIIKYYMGDSLQTNPSEVCWNDDGGWNPWLEYGNNNYTYVSKPEIIGNIWENPDLLNNK